MLNQIVLIFVFVVIINADYHQNQFNEMKYCGDFKPQGIVDVEKLFGNWFGIEVILHAREEDETIKYYNTCPKLFLAPVSTTFHPVAPRITTENWYTSPEHVSDSPETDWDLLMKPVFKNWRDNEESLRKTRRRYQTTTPDTFEHFKELMLRKLRLVWTEDNTKLEYSLQYNSSRPGYWMSFGFQNGSMLEFNRYKQFIGTIQVLQAVRSHVILTFCHLSLDQQFFSIVMSRKPYLNPQQLESIHSIMQWRNLPVKHIRRMCIDYSSGTKLNSYLLLQLFITLVLILYTKTS